MGTTLIAFLASIGSSGEAKKVVVVHAFVNVLGGIVLLFFASWIIVLVKLPLYLSTSRNIANVLMLINIFNFILFFPFLKYVERLTNRIFTEKLDEKSTLPSTWHIDRQAVEMPYIAVDLARVEISRMAKILGRMIDAAIIPFVQENIPTDDVYPKLSLVQGLDMREDKLDFLEKEVVQYLVQIGQKGIDEDLMAEVFNLVAIVNDIESIGDMVHESIVPIIAKKEFFNPKFSTEEHEKMIELHRLLSKRIYLIEAAISVSNREQSVKLLQDHIDENKGIFTDNFIRIAEDDLEVIRVGQIYMEIIDVFKRMGVYIENISKTLTSSIND